MGTQKQSTKANDYPLAKVLNAVLLSITESVRKVEAFNTLPDDFDWKLDELNRAYVLLVYELEQLYKHNPKLAEIEPKPFWLKYNMLESYDWEILRYLEEPNQKKGLAHINRLDRLCIIANSKRPELLPEHLELLEQAVKAINNYKDVLDAAEEADYEFNNDDAWYISEYWVSYNNGEIVINDVWKLKKTHIGSTIDQLLEQAFKNPNKLFIPKLPATARNLSTVLSSAGFIPVLRQLFFPKLSMKDGVLFRPTVTFQQSQKDNIDTTIPDLVLETLDPNLKNAR